MIDVSDRYQQGKRNFSHADLSNTNLTKAHLIKVDLTMANLSFANLVKANLTAAKIDYQLEDGLFEKISKHILFNPSVLDMNKWYCQHDDSSQTTRCLAGWAIHLAENGYKLQKKT